MDNTKLKKHENAKRLYIGNQLKLLQVLDN